MPAAIATTASTYSSSVGEQKPIGADGDGQDRPEKSESSRAAGPACGGSEAIEERRPQELEDVGQR